MSEVVDALLKAAYEARADHRPATARHTLLDAVDLCRKADDRQKLPQALTALGQVERDLHNLEIARKLYQEAAMIYQANGDQLKLAHTIRHVADIYRNQENRTLAERCYEVALDLYRKHGQPPALDLANALRGMALVKEELGKKEDARTLWQEAGQLYASVEVHAGVAESRRRIGLLGFPPQGS